MGRKRKIVEMPNTMKEDIRTRFIYLHKLYSKNEDKDKIVDIVNGLDDVEKNIIILFVACENKINKLAQQLQCSQQIAKRTIVKIKEKIKIKYNNILNSDE